MAPSPSPFFDPGPQSADNTLGILQLKRDLLIPAVLSTAPDPDYPEGKVVTTRFGIFPHSTLINQPWGSQVLASVVDTGSRGAKGGKKRKREKVEDEEEQEGSAGQANAQLVKALAASSGFIHLLPPTPETWTLSLPHRTQVVYTPDYSYILQRLQARPGDHIIEAGAGSGSFTHAAARAIFNGYPDQEQSGGDSESPKKKQKRYGQVYSFEYHEPRSQQLRTEIESHGLGSVVTVIHRDVYADGFCLPPAEASESTTSSEPAPNADIIFLDLPAPWLALKHLTRSPPPSSSTPGTPSPQTTESTKPFRSPLNPLTAARICTFSPCIEQVTKTVSALRQHGWVEISMCEIQAKRIEVRRERVGLSEEGLRGANPSARSVGEAVQRLRDVEGRAKIFHGLQAEKQKEVMRKAEARKKAEQARKEVKKKKNNNNNNNTQPKTKQDTQDVKMEDAAPVVEIKQESNSTDPQTTSPTDIKPEPSDPIKPQPEPVSVSVSVSVKKEPQPELEPETSKQAALSNLPPSKQDRLNQARDVLKARPVYKEGRLVHRTEQEIKTHTSYLVFAVLPREWKVEDEEKARRAKSWK